jgi:hypothetical protein
MGNELANRHPDKAHALFIDNAQGGYQVSVRAPLNIKMGLTNYAVNLVQAEAARLLLVLIIWKKTNFMSLFDYFRCNTIKCN